MRTMRSAGLANTQVNTGGWRRHRGESRALPSGKWKGVDCVYVLVAHAQVARVRKRRVCVVRCCVVRRPRQRREDREGTIAPASVVPRRRNGCHALSRCCLAKGLWATSMEIVGARRRAERLQEPISFTVAKSGVVLRSSTDTLCTNLGSVHTA